MTNGQSSIGSDRDGTSNPPLALELLRERAIARRRRDRQNQTANWAIVRARRQKMHMIVVCTGVLLLMGLAVYFEVERQPSPPPESAAPPYRAVGIA